MVDKQKSRPSNLVDFQHHAQKKTLFSSWRNSQIIIFILVLVLILSGLFILKKQPEKSNSTKNNIIDSGEIVFEHLRINFSKYPSHPTLKTHFTMYPLPRIPRVAEGITPEYEFTATNLDGTSYTEFNAPFKVTMDYTSSYIDDVKEETVSIYWHEAIDKEWQKLKTELDPTHKEAIAYHNKTGQFALMGELKVPPPPIGYSKQEFQLSDWKTYSNQQHNFSIMYPPNWKLGEEQYFKTEEIFSLSVLGDVQSASRGGTELFDGASFTIYEDQTTAVDLEVWAKEFYLNKGTGTKTFTINKEKAGQLDVSKIRVCGEYEYTCFSKYAILDRGKAYIIDIHTVGQDSQFFERIALEILGTLKFL